MQITKISKLAFTTVTGQTLMIEQSPSSASVMESNLLTSYNLMIQQIRFKEIDAIQSVPYQAGKTRKQLGVQNQEKDSIIVFTEADQVIGLSKVKSDGLISNQIISNKANLKLLTPSLLSVRSSICETKKTQFSFFNRSPQSQIQHKSFDNMNESSFNFASHVQYLSKNPYIEKYFSYGVQSAKQKSYSQTKDENIKVIGQFDCQNNKLEKKYSQQTESEKLQVNKHQEARRGSPKFKLVVKQSKKQNNNAELLEITLPKTAKKFEASILEDSKHRNKQHIGQRIDQRFKQLYSEDNERLLYAQPFENKIYSEISLLVPPSQQFDSSYLYKKQRSKKLTLSQQHLQTGNFGSNYEDKFSTIDTRANQQQILKNNSNQQDLSFEVNNYNDTEINTYQQPTRVVDLQQLLQQKQQIEKEESNSLTKIFNMRNQFSFQPQHQEIQQFSYQQSQVQEVGSLNSYQQEKTENMFENQIPFQSSKQPVKINLNIKQFMNNSVNESQQQTQILDIKKENKSKPSTGKR